MICSLRKYALLFIVAGPTLLTIGLELSTVILFWPMRMRGGFLDDTRKVSLLHKEMENISLPLLKFCFWLLLFECLMLEAAVSIS